MLRTDNYFVLSAAGGLFLVKIKLDKKVNNKKKKIIVIKYNFRYFMYM